MITSVYANFSVLKIGDGALHASEEKKQGPVLLGNPNSAPPKEW